MKILKSKTVKLLVYICSIVLIAVLLILSMDLNNHKALSNIVREKIVIEAGAKIPEAKTFFENPDGIVKFVTDVSSIDTKKIGETVIELEIDDQKFTSRLIIENKMPPTAKSVEQYIFKNNELTAENFVTDIESVLPVTVSFSVDSPPDFSRAGRQDITILLTNEQGLITKIESGMYVFDVKDELKIEIGTNINLTAKNFINNYIEIEVEKLSFNVEINELDFEKLGHYPVNLLLGQYKTESVVIIEDTTPPTAEPLHQYIFKGDELAPEDLVADITDITEVTCSFASPPDFFTAGWHYVKVILTDEGNNVTEIDSGFYVFDVKNELIIELGTVDSLTLKDFINNYIEVESLSFNSEINLTKTGSYFVYFELGVYSAQTSVIVRDTTPPKGTVRNMRAYLNRPLPASDFVSNIIDASPVTVRYKNPPDFSVQGKQAVYIILEDAHGNTTEYNAELTVVEDTAPPVISGNFNRTVIIGGTVSYSAGITVTDDYDPNVQLAVDSSGVNLNKAGVYPVIYSATDECGNRAEVKGSVTVRAINMDLVNETADKILAQIITANMTDYDKASAIFNWVNKNIKYSGASAEDIPRAAYEGLTKGRGDCYVYMASSQVLLTRANIKNVEARRVGGTSEHSWNLVNTGGGWYHFDVCPTPGNAISSAQRFMFTDSQAREYTKIIGSSRPNYYTYDKSTVPEVVE